MRKFKKTARFLVALTCLTSAFLVSVQFSDRGVQFDLRSSDGAANDAAESSYNLSALRILNRVLLHLKDSYVEPERIDPPKMLIASLNEIQNAVPEIVVDYDRSKPDVSPKEITVTVKATSKKFDVGNIQSLWEMSFKLKEIFGFIQDTLGNSEDVKYQDIEYAAINGMLETLDPHSTLLPPQNYQEMQTKTGGKFGGLGIVISTREGQLTVMSPIPDTPAARKGIKARDTIVRIGEESTVNMDLSEAVGLMRGDPGTKIDLWILRKGWDEPRKFTIERAIIKIESVTSQTLDDKVGYLRIKDFQANTFSDTQRHLTDLKKKMGGMQGLVLDLRGNPGGLLDQSIKISDLFLEEGTVVSTVGQGNKMREKKLAMRAGTEPLYPIVVLIDPGSASASEIVSGAIQNNNRGIVLGDTSFGKGSVQVIYEFPDSSALKLTVAQYLTPGDISIQGKGIIPDLRAVPVFVEKENVDLFLSKNVLREGNLATALTSKSTREAKSSQFVRFLKELPKGDSDEYKDPDAFEHDFQINLAQKLIVAAKDTWKRQDMLKAIQSELEQVEGVEATQIKAKLKEMDVDWSEGASPKKPSVDIAFKTNVPAGELIKAGSTIELTATITNSGTEPMYQVKALTESDHNIFDDREFIFGKLAPGESRFWTVDVKVSQDTSTREDFIRFDISDANTSFTKDPEKMPGLALKIAQQPRPHFAFSYELDDASGDGLLSDGEQVTLKLHVHNTGKADSAETLIYLKNFSREGLFLEKGRAKIDKIEAGKSAATEFTFNVVKAPKKGVFELEADVYDLVFREFTQKKFEIPYAKAGVKASKTGGKVTIKSAKTKAFVGASDTSQLAATLKKGDTFAVTAKTDAFYEVTLGSQSAWVPSSAVTFDKSKPKTPSSVDDLLRFASPDVTVTPSETLTDKSSITLNGTFSDNGKVKDYYVFVYNRQDTTFNTRKVVYNEVGKPSGKMKLEVPLFPGMNRVVVYVRDDDGMTTSENAYVYKK